MKLFFIVLIYFVTEISTQTKKEKNFDYVVACGIYIHDYIMERHLNKPIIQHPSLCTHIIINIDYDAIRIINYTNTAEQMNNIMVTKTQNPHLKILFSIFIKPIILNDEIWQNTMTEAEYFVKKYKLDGLNVERYIIDDATLSDLKRLKTCNGWMLTGMILPHLNLNIVNIFNVFDIVFVSDIGYYQNFRYTIGYMEANTYPDINVFIEELDDEQKRKLIIPISVRWFEYQIQKYTIAYKYFHYRCHVKELKLEGWTMKWNKYGKFNSAHKSDMLITYQNQKSTAEKIRYGIDNKIGGFIVLDQQFDRYIKGFCAPENTRDVFADVYNELTPLLKSPLYNEYLLKNRLIKCNAHKIDCKIDLGLPDTLSDYYSLLSMIRPAIDIYERVNTFKEQTMSVNLNDIQGTDNKMVQIYRNDSYFKISKPNQTIAIHNYTVMEVIKL